MKFFAPALALLAATTVSADDSIADGSFVGINICADGKEVKFECDFDILFDDFRRLAEMVEVDEQVTSGLRRKLTSSSPVDAFADLLNDCSADYDGLDLSIKLIGRSKELIEVGDFDLVKYLATAVLEEKVPTTAPVVEAEVNTGGRKLKSSSSPDTPVEVVTADSIQKDASLFSITVELEAKAGEEKVGEDGSKDIVESFFREFKVGGWGAC